MITHFVMKIMQLQFYLLVWCHTSETLMDKPTDLGQNVTINCDLDKEEVDWFLLKLPHPPVFILRTMPSGPFYSNERFKPKYLVQSIPHLFINNVSLDELGVYYCMITDGALKRKFNNGTRLHIADIPESQNNTLRSISIEKTECPTQWLVIMFGVINGVLVIVVIGLLMVFMHRRKRTSKNSETIQGDLQQPQDSEQTQFAQYAEVNLPKRCEPSETNSTYALVQMPKSHIYDNN